MLNYSDTEAVKEAFTRTSDDLTRSNINTKFRYIYCYRDLSNPNNSGSTFTCVLLRKNKIICANVGDSRGILCYLAEGKPAAKELTVEHKPNAPEEIKRIVASGGEVAKFRSKSGEEYGPYRVWVKGTTSPGLAVSRSFGDAVAASVGLTSEPHIIEASIRPEDRILIIASDGVWEKMTNEEVMRIAFTYCDKNLPEEAVNAIVCEARKRWISSGSRADDVTCILILLNQSQVPQQQ